MFDTIKEFFVNVIETGEFDVAEFIGIIQALVEAIFGIVNKEV